MKRIGIYGGTFDPIHIGHLITARAVKEIRNLSEIIFVPASISPLKQEIESSSTDHRLMMTKLALEKFPDFSVSNFEINNMGVSYTINTLKHFKSIYKNIELIIGYDNYLVFDKWHKWEEVLQLANIVVLKRLTENNIEPKVFSDKFIFVNTPTIEINSTIIRERCSKKLPIDLLVINNVLNYITENKLYTK
jgi:nicotinate-nucleotide adenylyltransferase